MARTGIEPKPPWRELPAPLRAKAAEMLGSSVVRGERAWGGYSPSPTFRLRLADGGRAFAKALSPDASDVMRNSFLGEVRTYESLADSIADWAPTMLGHKAVDGWEILLLEDLGNDCPLPWSQATATDIVQCFARFHIATRKTSLPNWVRHSADWLDSEGDLWDWTTSPSKARERASVGGYQANRMAAWFSEHGPLLHDTASQLLDASVAPQLIHRDVRSDNLRWADGQLYLLDWACVAASAVEYDVVAFAQTITVESGIDPEITLAAYNKINPLNPRLVDAAVCAVAGFFADRAWREDIPGLPRLRDFQRRQLFVTMSWAARRLGIEGMELP
jgi:hypothetical protein